MVSLLRALPGADLLRQAWDATKLAGAVLDRRRGREVVLAQERAAQVAPYRGKNAVKRAKEVFEEGDPHEIARLFLPDTAIEAVKTAGRVWWKIWDLYWIFLILR